MLRPLNELRGAQIAATDGVIGHVVGAYFDDARWTVRYLVVNTGTWLDAREVLISPTSLDATASRPGTLAARLTRKQVEDSPSIDLAKPVSRQEEDQITQHYGWPGYWGMGLWESRVPGAMAALEASERSPAPPRQDGDPHLRSSREVIGYHLHATDGALGHVEDLIIDDAAWAISYLAVDTANWWFGGHVLISPQWIRAVRWPERLVDVAVTRDVIKHGPTWKPSDPISREYEGRVLDYYRVHQVWPADRSSSDAPRAPSSPR
jgi:hypothetical protein